MEDNKLIAEFMWKHSIVVDISDAKYHESSDWLDPVVQKIEKYLWDNQGKIGYFDECLQSNDDEVRYQAVVDFIKHINQ